jgi:hypothetical protein
LGEEIFLLLFFTCISSNTVCRETRRSVDHCICNVQRLDCIIDSDDDDVKILTICCASAEILILGLISFLLFFAEYYGFLEFLGELDQWEYIDTDVTNIGELLHLLHTLLFITMLIYLVTVIVTFLFTNCTRRQWDQYENLNRSK